jgi:hypothetical protein
MRHDVDFLIGLRGYGTERQQEILEEVIKYGSNNKAAKATGFHRRTIDQGINGLIKNAAMQGYSPAHDMVHTVPDGFKVKGVSTYYDEDGKPRGQWVKSTADDARREIIWRETIDALKEEIPRLKPITEFMHGNDALCNTYVITDFHLGMLAWSEETKGDDWDVDIAEKLLIKWFEQAIAQSPNAKQAVFAQMSDFLHFDGMDAVTPASKHLLDVDTRFSKLVRVAIRVLRKVIDMLLVKHESVHVLMLDANHDPVSQIWLREWFSVLYENEPRITIDTSPNPYNAYEFGKVALFFHHGHKKKVSEISKVFVGMFREMFGRTLYAYAHTGHLHSIDVKEDQLMIVEQHRTLSPNDAYAARGGWLSGRDAKCITYHRQYGEVSRITINSNMLA